MPARYCVRSCVEAETSMVSVERLKQFCGIASEEEEQYDLICRQNAERVKQIVPEKGWPAQGRVTFKHIVIKYSPHSHPAVDDLSLEIRPASRIGVVGRTGAGKSSLVSALFRLVVPTSGAVLIDGIDISMLSLASLRRGISIIPQEPVLFSNTVRFNVDPAHKHRTCSPCRCCCCCCWLIICLWNSMQTMMR